MTKFIAILLILSTPAYADNAITVKTGYVVPPEYNGGTLLDSEKAEKIRDQLIERDGFEKENESYKKSIEYYKSNELIYTKQNDILLSRNIQLTETLNDSREMSGWTKVGFFVLGVAVTSAAVYGASRLVK